MSMDILVQAVIGVEVNYEKLHQKTSKRGCEHEDSKTPFCPKCGKPTQVTEKETQYDVEDRLRAHAKKLGLQVFTLGPECDEYLYVGHGVETDYQDGAASVPVKLMSKQEKAVEQFLKNLGLPQQPIKLWAVPYVSC